MSTTCDEVGLIQNRDVPELIPARMLNEFAYCPRLAYLEWVQGEFADNLDTIEGRFGHRRVDTPSRAEVPEPGNHDDNGQHQCDDDSSRPPLDPQSSALDPPPANEQLHTRSLMLSAPGEGLIAKMDLVDFQGGVAVPVDYKHGRMPDVPGGAWEPEQVQLCAQGLILRENGYQCEGGMLYYVDSRRRVTIAFDDRLVERTRDLLRELRAAAARRVLPPPLDDSPFRRCALSQQIVSWLGPVKAVARGQVQLCDQDHVVVGHRPLVLLHDLHGDLVPLDDYPIPSVLPSPVHPLAAKPRRPRNP